MHKCMICQKKWNGLEHECILSMDLKPSIFSSLLKICDYLNFEPSPFIPVYLCQGLWWKWNKITDWFGVEFSRVMNSPGCGKQAKISDI